MERGIRLSSGWNTRSSSPSCMLRPTTATSIPSIKKIESADYKLIAAFNRTHYNGRIAHVTGIVNIPAKDYERMRHSSTAMASLDFPQMAQSIDRFISKVKTETNGEVVGDLEIVRISLDLSGPECDQPAVAARGHR